MRVILTGLGSRGDVFPYLGFGQALLRRGHSVAMITTANYRPFLDEAGIEYIELAGADFYQDLEAGIQNTADTGGFFFRRAAPQANRDFVDKVLSVVPQRVVRLVEEYAVPGDTVFAPGDLFNLGTGRLVSDRYGIPHVSLSVVPGWFMYSQPALPVLSPRLQNSVKDLAIRIIWQARDVWKTYQSLREQLGLPPGRDRHSSLLLSDKLNIALFPRWYVPHFRKGLTNVLFTDFPLYESGQSSELPDDLKRFLAAGRPPVVFTTASWRFTLNEFFRASADACQKLGERAILLTGNPTGMSIPERPGVFAIDYVSLHLLLPHAAAFVSHGGIGTFARAMVEGVPQLLTPMLPEQRYNAGKAKSLGIGFSVKVDSYPKVAESALRRLLNTSSFREKSRAVAGRFPQTPHFEEAMVRMEQLVDQGVKA